MSLAVVLSSCIPSFGQSLGNDSPFLAATDLIRFSANRTRLTVSELFLLERREGGASDSIGAASFPLALPRDAQLRSCIGEDEQGNPVALPSSQRGRPGQYSVHLPGARRSTKLQVVYELPYTGLRHWRSQTGVPVRTLAVMLPNSMKFRDQDGVFQTIRSDPAVNMFVLHDVPKAQTLAFTISGEGALQQETRVPPSGTRLSEPQHLGALRNGPTQTQPSQRRVRGREWFFIAGAAGTLLALGTAAMHLRRKRARRSAMARARAVQDLREQLFALQLEQAGDAVSRAAYRKRLGKLRSELQQLLAREGEREPDVGE